ncbi:HxsD-like protein [Patescibacteria group bacterium]|nr:HxsD-like protein [Patescibacteria group bacterium]
MIIKFSSKIYDLKAVKLTTKAYQGLADFKISQLKNYINVELKNINKDVKDIIKDEFCNYVLSLMKLK